MAYAAAKFGVEGWMESLRFDLQPFSTDALSRSPIVLIGTFTAVNNAGAADGPRDAYRICLALADLRSKSIVSKGVSRAKPEGIDVTPTQARRTAQQTNRQVARGEIRAEKSER